MSTEKLTTRVHIKIFSASAKFGKFLGRYRIYWQECSGREWIKMPEKPDLDDLIFAEGDGLPSDR